MIHGVRPERSRGIPDFTGGEIPVNGMSAETAPGTQGNHGIHGCFESNRQYGRDKSVLIRIMMMGVIDMDMEILKKALIRGVPTGLAFAALVTAVRSLLDKTPFFDNLFSWLGILYIVCFVVGDVIGFYNDIKKKQDKQKKQEEEGS